MNTNISPFNKILTRSLIAGREFISNNQYKKRAKLLLNSIESEKGKLDYRIKKRCDEYARDVLGGVKYSPWLYIYSALNGIFKEGWIPNNYYNLVVIPKIKNEYKDISSIRTLTASLFGTSYFPDIAYYANGMFTTPLFNIIPLTNIRKHLFNDNEKVVYKLNNSRQGKGVYIFNGNDFDINDVISLGNGSFQYYIEQNEFFNEFTPDSTATIRITSVMNDEGVTSCRAAYLRLGRKTDTLVMSRSAVKIPIDINNGKLSAIGYLPNMQSIDKHPDSNVAFYDKYIPHFNKCINIINNLHKKIPFNRCIGWDLIIDITGEIKIMEWNGNQNDIKFTEATAGPCFVDLEWDKLWRITSDNIQR